MWAVGTRNPTISNRFHRLQIFHVRGRYHLRTSVQVYQGQRVLPSYLPGAGHSHCARGIQTVADCCRRIKDDGYIERLPLARQSSIATFNVHHSHHQDARRRVPRRKGKAAPMPASCCRRWIGRRFRPRKQVLDHSVTVIHDRISLRKRRSAHRPGPVIDR